jgi:diguanylate cyclase (GGDEF)-like protein
VVDRTEALFETNRVLREQIAERERAEGRLRHAALHDALTGLPNRAFLLGRLGEALERYARHPERRFAVLFLDLDRFKVVNDSVGHLVGDELLKEAGARIAAQCLGQTVVARLGGDEFAVLLEPITRPEDAAELAASIISALDEPIRAGGKDLYSSTSIGIAVAMPHYSTGEELLRDADVALYRAKARGRRRYEMFDETLRREALHQLELEGNLRRALARNEFEPVFQPILSLADGRVVGYEALLRWRHPLQGLVAPGEFLAQAEESGLAEAIDWQVYESAFAQAHGLIGEDAYIGINVGAKHLRSPMFIDDLMRQLDRYELAPRRLRIEVTERALLEDPDQVRRLMVELGELGVRIALDDFGTGYSSLSYLHRFPLHALKIDRSFVSPIGSDAPGNTMTVLRAIHALGTSLGLEIIAEGIETPEQLQALRGIGCEYGQGFLLARPQPASALRAAS